jgi:RND family efflux transporter MFP subunit
MSAHLPSRLAALLAAALSLAAVAVPALAAEAPTAAAQPALTVRVVTPQAGELSELVPANGSVAAWQEASVGSEAQGLRLAQVRAQVGDRVRRGEVLAVFAADMLRAELAQAQAAVAEAEAALAEAKGNADRARELRPSGVISAQQTTQILTTEQRAQAHLQAQRALLQVQQLRLAQAEVRAPDDGIISARNATVGAVVPAGQELFRLIRQGRLEWLAEVPSAELARIRPGQSAEVRPDGAAPLQGTVRMVAPTVAAGTRNGLVYVTLPDAPAVRAGMFARGHFVVGRSAGQTLPQTAVLLREGLHHVFLVDVEGRVQQRKVGVGRLVGERIEITTPLPATARVVASGGAFLADGDLVRVVDGADPAR